MMLSGPCKPVRARATRLRASLLIVALTVPAAANAGIAFVISAPYAPPPPRTEQHSMAPFRDAVWVDGRWAWRGGRYVWVGGHWEHRQDGMHGWHPGDWAQQGAMWIWHAGKWF